MNATECMCVASGRARVAARSTATPQRGYGALGRASRGCLQQTR